jgi:4-aminobutyrate aminotransferase
MSRETSIDFTAGAAVANIGYCHPKVVRAVVDEVRNLTHGLTLSFTNEPSVVFAEGLAQITPGTFEKRVWLGSSGSDAAETTYDLLPAASRRRKIISFFGSHHGLTVGSNFLSGHKISSRYLQSPSVVKVPYPNCYRCPYKKGDICCNYCIDFIEKEVFNNICPPEDTACFLFEPIESFAGEVGST